MKHNKPRSRAELVKAILPHYQGRKQDVREMSVAHLRELYENISLAALIGLIKK